MYPHRPPVSPALLALNPFPGRAKQSTSPRASPELRSSAERGVPRRSLPRSARGCSARRDRGMCLLAAGEPGRCCEAAGAWRRREGMERALRGAPAAAAGRGWERSAPGLRLQPHRGSAAGLGCPAGGTEAALPLIAGRLIKKTTSPKQKRLVQPIAPFLPREQLEGGDSLLLPGLLHRLRGENPTSKGTLGGRRFACFPQLAPWDPPGWAKTCYPQHARRDAPRLLHTREVLES